MVNRYLKIIVCFLAVFAIPLIGKDRVGVEEKLGQKIPMDATFTTSDGKTVALKDIINKPTAISLVYYHCPGICSPLLTSLGEVVDNVQLKPGQEFQVISLSFDHHETPEQAKEWKRNYFAAMDKAFPEDAWLFLTGDSANIAKLTNAVGFYFKSDGKNDYMHPPVTVVVSPDGKITRYLMGSTFLPFDLKMAFIEASKGIPTSTINKALEFCFSYDPEGGQYVFNVTRIVGGAMIIFAAAFLTFLIVKGRNTKEKVAQ
jgi:protein SCO1/2